nr:MAG TPA: hypothetical protein [Caudoviricetes sp.]
MSRNIMFNINRHKNIGRLSSQTACLLVYT